jgi:hypothetical protein
MIESVSLDADEPPVECLRSHSGASDAGKRIEHDLSGTAAMFYRQAKKLERLHRLMMAFARPLPIRCVWHAPQVGTCVTTIPVARMKLTLSGVN